jgi:hypothetical protein
MPCYPRSSKGFVDFDLQTRRPDMKLKSANDARFLTFNPFPGSHSIATHKARIQFEK